MISSEKVYTLAETAKTKQNKKMHLKKIIFAMQKIKGNNYQNIGEKWGECCLMPSLSTEKKKSLSMQN